MKYIRKVSAAEWFCSRFYEKSWKLQQAWAISDGSDANLRLRGIDVSQRYKRLCKVLDNR